MSFSCCCQGQKWCANVYFAGLSKHKKAHFASIEFSTDSPQISKGLSHHPPAYCPHLIPEGDTDADPSIVLAKSYDFVQKKSRFGFHPQIGVPPEKPIVQQPQQSQPGAFMTRFRRIDAKSSPHARAGHGLDPSLSVYREESTTPQMVQVIPSYNFHFTMIWHNQN